MQPKQEMYQKDDHLNIIEKQTFLDHKMQPQYFQFHFREILFYSFSRNKNKKNKKKGYSILVLPCMELVFVSPKLMIA